MTRIRVLFLYPNAVLQNPPPVALALFAARLRSLPCELRLFDTTRYDTEEQSSDKAKEEHLQVRPFDFAERNVTLKTTDLFADLRAQFADYAPDLVAMSCNEMTWQLGRRLLDCLPAGNGPTVLVGGVFPTFAPEEVLAHPAVTAVCCGEGEEALADAVERLAAGEGLAGIANLWVKTPQGVVRGPLRAVSELDDLPLPDYSIFEEERFYRPMAGKVRRLFPLETSRGCPYQCSFCNSPAQRNMFGARYFRKKSMARIARELHELVERWQPEYLYFLSDTLLCLNDDEFDSFCRMYGQFRLPFWCQNRPEMITLPRMQRLRDIGCERMSIGVEHGNEEFRRRVLRKPTTNDAIIRAFAAAAAAGIPTTVNNIIGFPGETRELAFDTIRLNRQLLFDTTNAYAFMPFRGTELYEVCRANNYFRRGRQAGFLTKGTCLDMPQFRADEIDGLVKTFSLYARLPEEYFPRIRIAEGNGPEADAAFAELSAEYRRRYFS